MNESELFFFAEAIRHARGLPLGDAVTFLDGMASSIGRAHPGHDQIAEARALFTAGDAQLELIAIGQLNFGDRLS